MDPVSPLSSAPHSARQPGNAERDRALFAKAQELEATFLAEMLRHAGLGEADSAFAGGVGEEQFASFLRNEQALAMARSGGIGLAETLFNAMKRAEDA